ncbi:co-chaperone GroES [Candidatus Shapirobacteria bacterium]|nr:co-chaperone GroES [Candidatus Shapirobacteria bacterium]
MTVALKITPASGYILVEPTKNERKTASGIVLPDSHEEKPQKGKVLAVGGVEITESGVKRESPCKVGQTVIYKEWGGNEYKEGEKEYLFIKFEDILGIVR